MENRKHKNVSRNKGAVPDGEAPSPVDPASKASTDKGGAFSFVRHAGGAPRQYSSVEDMETAIDGYFNSCFEEQERISIGPDKKPIVLKVRVQTKPFTVSGLAVYLNLTRQGLINYEGRPEFVDTIKKAKGIIEAYAEERLFAGAAPAGIIFSLKNNYGWVDKREVDAHHKFTLEELLGGDDDEG